MHFGEDAGQGAVFERRQARHDGRPPRWRVNESAPMHLPSRTVRGKKGAAGLRPGGPVVSEDDAFRDLIRRARAGDQQAATELVERYEPTVRLVVRRRLTDPQLRRLLDSMDICQSILGNFFAGVALGRFELENAEQLLKLLSTMARNKLTSYARKQRAARRDPHGAPRGRPERPEGIDQHPSPSQVVADQELLQEFRRRLSPQERRLAELRALDRSWSEIAAEVGGNPDGLRMQLTRAVARVARELGMEA
jgi:RNA polymerase sigma factor (sigma-70 family)